jgi:nicotinamide-nucleotide amidase
MKLAQQVFEKLSSQGLKLATAESCTGGMVAAAITDIAGSSTIFDRGFVTYSNAAKIELLNVPLELIEQYGAVSEQVASAMAQGAFKNSNADITIAITGIAGPTGGSTEKPVGLVWFAVATRNLTHVDCKKFGAVSRSEIREKATQHALGAVLRQINTVP